MDSFLICCLVAAVWQSAILCASQRLPSNADRLCSHSLRHYSWEEQFSYDFDKNYWESEVHHYILSVINTTNITTFNHTKTNYNYHNTWIIETSNKQKIISYCDALTVNINISQFPMSNINPGDPAICEHWNNKNNLYFESQFDPDWCYTINTNLENYLVNFIFLGWCSIIIIILICPCCKKCNRNVCDEKEYEAVSIEMYEKVLLHQGINAKAQATEYSSKSIAKLLLQYDIDINKLVWYNDIYKDFFIFVRSHHPFFAIIYGHPLHAYRKRMRILTFFIIFWLSMVQTWSNYQHFSDPKENQLSVGGIAIIIGTAITVTMLHVVLRVLSMCDCCRFNSHNSRCCCTKKCIGFALSRTIIYGLFLPFGFLSMFVCIILFFGTHNHFPEINVANFVIICFIREWTSIFVSWFVIYSFIICVYFYNEWYQQNGIKTHKCITLLGVLVYRNNKCILSWCGCWCCCCCCHYASLYRKTQTIQYRKDKETNTYMIGNRRGEFAVTWYEYKQYKNSIVENDKDKDVAFEQSIYANTPKRDIEKSINIAHLLTDDTIALRLGKFKRVTVDEIMLDTELRTQSLPDVTSQSDAKQTIELQTNVQMHLQASSPV